jgi:hypothetical protein
VSSANDILQHWSQVDTTLVSGLLQANATLGAAKITAAATVEAGWFTLGGGIFVLAAAFIALLQSYISSLLNKSQKRTRYASTYIAEISSLQNFLDANDVRGTLKDAINNVGIWNFHPGNNWLLTYRDQPSSVGVFAVSVSTAVVSYCCRMTNELGRLVWLHELPQAAITANGRPWYDKELTNSLKTLDKLFEDSIELLSNLETSGSQR